MNDFEYKAYHRLDKKVYEVAQIDFVTKRVGVLKELTNSAGEPQGEFTVVPADFTEVELMQNTGLTDKKTRAIYRGNIVKTPMGHYMKIIYSHGSFGAVDIYNSLIFGVLSDPKFFDNKELEVVGDIYTNKELLKIN